MEPTAELERMTGQEIMMMLERAACPMLRGRNWRLMTKQMMIDHLVKSKCPELAKYMRPRRPSTSGSESSGHSLNHK
jgi:hypothetical protein